MCPFYCIYLLYSGAILVLPAYLLGLWILTMNKLCLSLLEIETLGVACSPRRTRGIRQHNQHDAATIRSRRCWIWNI